MDENETQCNREPMGPVAVAPVAGDAEITRSPRTKQLIVDTDVHEPASLQDIIPYLAKEWQFHVQSEGISKKVPPGSAYVLPMGQNRHDLRRPSGTTAAEHLEQMQSQLLDKHGIDYAILTGFLGYGFMAMPQVEFAAGLASAYNSWVIETWLDQDPRLRGSITVTPQRPRLAAAEIDRVASHPSMVQVMLLIASPQLAWGHEYFDPIWTACVRNDLPVAFHIINPVGVLGNLTQSGWPASYVEARTLGSGIFVAQLTSMVLNGVFEKFPRLRVAMLEGGFGWVAPLMWRMDQSWRGVRMELPWLRRRPSDYIREHVKFSTQPFEEPDDPKHLLQLIDMMGSEELLMFSTDYPHWDFDSPQRAIPNRPKSLQNKILWENARDFYGLRGPT